MLKPFKISLIIVSFLLSLWGLKDQTVFLNHFKGDREIANDCSQTVLSIIKKEIPKKIESDSNQQQLIALKHYQFKNSLWSKILSAKDFENFDENEYFRYLEIYKSESGKPNNLLLFNPTTIEKKLALIEAIQTKFAHFENLESVQDEVQSLGAYKLRKLQKLMRKFDLNSTMTRANLESFSSDFFLILKEPPIAILDNLTETKTVRMSQRMMRILEEDMLAHGLKGTLDSIPLRPATRIEYARFYIKKIMKFKVWRILVFPYDLPWVDRVKISDELLEKIFIDGLDAHKNELMIELKNQNLIDDYERLRRVYRPVAFGIGFYFYYQKFQGDLKKQEDKNNEEEKKKFMDAFKKLVSSIKNETDSREKTDIELKDEQFARVLQSFKDRYNADPTPEEYNELKQKIYGN